MKNILIACDSFKGSLKAEQVVAALAHGWKSVDDESNLILCPLADGGEGSLEAIYRVLQAEKITVESVDATGAAITAYFLWEKETNTAYIEMANVVGLEQLPKNMLNPNKTSTFGLGLVIQAAINLKVSRIILFVGGSATNDMGIGAAQAIGVNFLYSTKTNKYLSGEDMEKIEDFKLNNLDTMPQIIVATDVKNPLFGPNGASLTYGYQKGGNKSDLEKMDAAMKKLAERIHKKTNKNLQNLSGGGAAGGIAAGMVGFFNARIVGGADLIFDLLSIEDKISSADMIITGEGKMDSQTLEGKLISRLSHLAKKYHKPIIAVCGDITLTQEKKDKLGIIDSFSLLKWTNNASYSSESTILHLREIGVHIAQKYLES